MLHYEQYYSTHCSQAPLEAAPPTHRSQASLLAVLLVLPPQHYTMEHMICMLYPGMVLPVMGYI